MRSFSARDDRGGGAEPRRARPAPGEAGPAGLRALRADLAGGAGLASFAPPAEALPREVETKLAAIVARRGEQEAKLAAIMQQIAQKAAEAEENAATLAKLRAMLPVVE